MPRCLQRAYCFYRAWRHRLVQIRYGAGKTDDFCIVSKMPVKGVVFSDGMEEDAIDFHSGTENTVRIADRTGKLMV